mmetsp:Transcript_13615/g.21399  ORF Transcript_13615/g.21399 Transcript_13615/m.21399 type:complete len:259 (+) Transcript_13615:99-875(+)
MYTRSHAKHKHASCNSLPLQMAELDGIIGWNISVIHLPLSFAAKPRRYHMNIDFLEQLRQIVLAQNQRLLHSVWMKKAFQHFPYTQKHHRRIDDIHSMHNIWSDKAAAFRVVFVDLDVLQHPLRTEAFHIKDDAVSIDANLPELVASFVRIRSNVLRLAVLVRVGVHVIGNAFDTDWKSIVLVGGNLELMQQTNDVREHRIHLDLAAVSMQTQISVFAIFRSLVPKQRMTKLVRSVYVHASDILLDLHVVDFKHRTRC